MFLTARIEGILKQDWQKPLAKQELWRTSIFHVPAENHYDRITYTISNLIERKEGIPIFFKIRKKGNYNNSCFALKERWTLPSKYAKQEFWQGCFYKFCDISQQSSFPEHFWTTDFNHLQLAFTCSKSTMETPQRCVKQKTENRNGQQDFCESFFLVILQHFQPKTYLEQLSRFLCFFHNRQLHTWFTTW